MKMLINALIFSEKEEQSVAGLTGRSESDEARGPQENTEKKVKSCTTCDHFVVQNNWTAAICSGTYVQRVYEEYVEKSSGKQRKNFKMS